MNNKGIIRIGDLEGRIDDVEADIESLKKQADEIRHLYDQHIVETNHRINVLEAKYTLAKQSLSLKEVAKMLQMTPETAYKLARAGKIPGYRPNNGKLVFMATEIFAWIKSRPCKKEEKELKIKKAEEWRAKHHVNKKQDKG